MFTDILWIEVLGQAPVKFNIFLSSIDSTVKVNDVGSWLATMDTNKRDEPVLDYAPDMH